jgi:hypothetical protein
MLARGIGHPMWHPHHTPRGHFANEMAIGERSLLDVGPEVGKIVSVAIGSGRERENHPAETA